MKLVFLSKEDRADDWKAELRKQLPDLEFLVWPGDMAGVEIASIDYTLAWKPPAGVLKSLTGLKYIQSLGAGVDGLLVDPELPTHIPISRLVDRSLTQGMTQFVVYNVLHYHRGFGAYAERQREGLWKGHRQIDPRTRRVGIMGLGELGTDAAEKLLPFEFDLAAWSRSPKSMPGVISFHGADGLDAFLARTEILVCLLPLTDATRGIVNAANLAKLPQGAVVINCGRGGHVVDDDLLAALDGGHIAGACLDVFNTEPLPAGHPYWTHPKVRITPHVASLTAASSAAEYVAENICRVECGELPLNVVDLASGY
ncbi:MAG: glyoxylate/hydroxypyruvate reductase A [Rhodospirillaceae bacterium]